MNKEARDIMIRVHNTMDISSSVGKLLWFNLDKNFQLKDAIKGPDGSKFVLKLVLWYNMLSFAFCKQNIIVQSRKSSFKSKSEGKLLDFSHFGDRQLGLDG